MRIPIAAWMLAGCCCAAAQSAEPNQLTAQERRDGWRLLFDGKTTAGWLEVTGKPFPTNCWTIENGSLKALVRTDGFQDIRTAESFRSFDLQFDWMLKADGNSGVKYLIQNVDEWVNKAGRQARARGLEYQLADNHNEDAASDPRKVAGALYSLIAPWGRPSGLPGESTAPSAPGRPGGLPHIGEFNHSRLLVDGRHVEHWMNGVKVVEFETTAPEVQKLLRANLPKGASTDAPLVETSPISLQNHSSETWFRNIKIRALP